MYKVPFESLFVFSHFQVASQLDKKAKITKDHEYDLLELAISSNLKN